MNNDASSSATSRPDKESLPLHYCPVCGARLTSPQAYSTSSQESNLDVFGVHEHLEESPSHARVFHWWVTPLNLLFLIGFLIIIDLSTPPTIGFPLDWALWPAIAIVILFVFSYILSKRPESFWIMGPLIFIVISLFLFELDKAYGKNTGFLGLDWATIPISALLTFGVFIPINSKLGYKQKTPLERYLEVVDE